MTGKRRPLIPGRKRPWEGKSLSSIAATVPICTPLTLTGAPTFEPVEVALEHADEADRLGEHAA